MNNLDTLKTDKLSREKIINNTDENYFVEAGAGSGKTTTLVSRMVSMIRQGKNIQELAAITFTKAAAKEFYSRFQKMLIERINDPSESDEDRDNFQNALNGIDLAFMGTIDSFCNMIMSEHPSEGGIPSESSVISDEEATALYKREYLNILNGVGYPEELTEKAKLFTHYHNYPEDTFILVLSVLINHRDCELCIPDRPLFNVDEKFKDSIISLRKIVSVLLEHPEYIIGKDYVKDGKPGERAADLIESLERYRYVFMNSWEDNVSGVINAYKKSFNNYCTLYKDSRVEEALGPAIRHFETDKKGSAYKLNGDFTEIMTELKELTYKVTLDFIWEAKDLILAKLRKEGKLTFNDYLIYLRDTLKNDAENGGTLIRYIQRRHKYYMIDEFQDTDPVQAEIFFYLSARTIRPDWRDCIPEKGSMFIVGDPKQSIYRFKNADVASYLNVKKMFENPEVGEVLYLTANFRSTFELKTWFNKTFEEMFVEDSEQASYPQIPTEGNEEVPGSFSGVYMYESDTRSSTEDVTAILATMHDNPAYMISDKNGSLRKLEWKDFMIITPSKTKLAEHAACLRSYGIPYYVEGNVNFKECRALITLTAIYSAITCPSDNRLLYAALKSPHFNIKDSELMTAVNKGAVLSIDSEIKKEDMSPPLYSALSLLKQLSKEAADLSPSLLFAYLIETLNVFKKTGNSNMEYLYFALELLKSEETSNEIITHREAAQFLNGLLDNGGGQERCPGLLKDGDQVHMANLHKVKGLEAPVVILAYPSFGNRGPEFRLERGPEGNKGYLFNVSKDLGGGRSTSVIETAEFGTTKDKNENCPVKLEVASQNKEKIRLAYVAATRARNVLIISSKRKTDGTQYAANPWGVLLKEDRPYILEKSPDITAFAGLPSLSSEDIKKTYSILNNDSLFVPSYELRRPSKEKADNSSEDLETDERIIKHTEEAGGDTLATVSGTLVHRMMELILNSRDSFRKEDLLERVMSEYDINVPGFNAETFKERLSEVYDVLHNGGYRQINGAEDDILEVLKHAEEIYCEVPFTYEEGTTVWNGIIDLLYKKDGVYHIIDWKTNKSDIGLREHYKNQLEAYKKAVKKASGTDVEDALIYHIDIKQDYLFS